MIVARLVLILVIATIYSNKYLLHAFNFKFPKKLCKCCTTSIKSLGDPDLSFKWNYLRVLQKSFKKIDKAIFVDKDIPGK